MHSNVSDIESVSDIHRRRKYKTFSWILFCYFPSLFVILLLFIHRLIFFWFYTGSGLLASFQCFYVSVWLPTIIWRPTYLNVCVCFNEIMTKKKLVLLSVHVCDVHLFIYLFIYFNLYLILEHSWFSLYIYIYAFSDSFPI